MLKALGIVMILCSFTGIGMAQKQQYQGRVKTLQALLSALDLIAGELSFRLTSIPDIITLLTKSSNAGVSALFFKLRQSMAEDDGLSPAYKWMKVFQTHGETVGLQHEDIAILCDMSDFIGKYDSKSQQNCIAHARQRLEVQLKQAEQEVKSKGTVYRTCCIAAGGLLVLVLI